MRILHFDSDALEAPLGGGQARRTFEVNRRLARRHDITVITAGYRGVKPATIDGIRYVRMVPLPAPSHLIGYFLETLPRALFTGSDVVVEDFTAPFTAAGLPLVLRRPVIGVASYLFGRQAAAKYRLPIDRIESALVGRYRYLEALTPAQELTLHAMAPRAHIRVIGNGADEDAFDHPWEGGDYVAFLGRFDRTMKGLDLLLDAAAQLPLGLRVKIAGDGAEREWLTGEILRRGLESRIELVGRLSGSDRHRFLARAAVLAFPSRYENQSLVALDALAIGVPTVAFDVPSMRDVFEDCAVLVPAFDVWVFAQCLAKLAADRAAATEMSVRARLRGATHRWDLTAKLHEQFLEDVVFGRPG
jgi:glycosyltransferase involved in cell wall biosynthesis